MKLLDACFGIKNASKEALIRWKYFSPSFFASLVASVAKDDQNNLVGFYCNKLLPMVAGTGRYSAGVCLDMATHPDHRGKGLISKLFPMVYQKVREQGVDFSFGFSNQSGIKVDQHSSNYGYFVVAQLQSSFKPLFHAVELGVRTERVTSFDVPVLPFTKAFQVVPSKDYLTWRYLKKPAAKYEVFSVSEGDHHQAYLILLFSAYKVELLKILPTTEHLDLTRMIQAAQNIGIERGKKMMTLLALKNAFWEQQLKMSNFTVVAYQRSHYYLTVKPHRTDPDFIKKVCDPDAWAVLGGDVL